MPHPHQANIPNIDKKVDEHGMVTIFDIHEKKWVKRYSVDAMEMIRVKSGTFSKKKARRILGGSAAKPSDDAEDEKDERKVVDDERTALILRKLSTSTKRELSKFVRANDLDIDLDDFETLDQKRRAVGQAYALSVSRDDDEDGEEPDEADEIPSDDDTDEEDED